MRMSPTAILPAYNRGVQARPAIVFALAFGALLVCGCSGPTRGRDPDIAVQPTGAVLFGRVIVGEEAESPVVVRNVGDGELVVDRVTLRGGATSAYRLVEAAPPGALAPGAAAEIAVVYAPVAGGGTTDTLEIASNDPDEPLVLVEIVASDSGPHLRVEPALVDFGLVEGRTGPVATRVVNDGTQPVTVGEIVLVGGADFTFEAAAPAGTVLQPGDAFGLTVTYAFDPAGAGNGRVEVRPVESGTPDAHLELRGPPLAAVGADVNIEPLEVAILDGRPSAAPGNVVSEYRWTLAEAPAGSHTAEDFAAGLPQIVKDEERCPAGQNEVARPCFFPDVPGIYAFDLVVVDRRPSCALGDAGEGCSDDDECCSFQCGGGVCLVPGMTEDVCAQGGGTGCEIASVNSARQLVRAIPEQAVFVTVSWNGDGDLDLHMVRDSGTNAAWTATPDDCFWSNPAPDWGAPDPSNGVMCTTSAECTVVPYTTCRKPVGMPGTCIDATDDPRLVIDDTDGFGPEAIGMKLPPADTYHVGVHYYPDEHMSPRRATVHFFVLGEELFPPGYGPGAPVSTLLDRNDFWYVGRVVVPAVIADATIEAAPINLQNPRANAEPGNYPNIP